MPGSLCPRLREITGRCPPEELGGTSRYKRFPSCISNPEHPNHEEAAERAGKPFDPNTPDACKLRLGVLKLGKEGSHPPSERLRRTMAKRVRSADHLDCSDIPGYVRRLSCHRIYLPPLINVRPSQDKTVDGSSCRYHWSAPLKWSSHWGRVIPLRRTRNGRRARQARTDLAESSAS